MKALKLVAFALVVLFPVTAVASESACPPNGEICYADHIRKFEQGDIVLVNIGDVDCIDKNGYVYPQWLPDVKPCVDEKGWINPSCVGINAKERVGPFVLAIVQEYFDGKGESKEDSIGHYISSEGYLVQYLTMGTLRWGRAIPEQAVVIVNW